MLQGSIHPDEILGRRGQVSFVGLGASTRRYTVGMVNGASNSGSPPRKTGGMRNSFPAARDRSELRSCRRGTPTAPCSASSLLPVRPWSSD